MHVVIIECCLSSCLSTKQLSIRGFNGTVLLPRKKSKFLSEKNLCGSPLYLYRWLIWHSYCFKQRHIRCAKKCSPGVFFMCHFLKHLLYSCYVKQRHFRCTRIDSFCVVTVSMPLQTFCNCFLAVSIIL